MKKKLYILIVHILAFVGLLLLVEWALKRAGVVDRKYSLHIGENVSVGFSDIDDYIEVFNYDGEPSLYKAIALFVDNEVVNITKIQTTSNQEKGIEIFFDSYVKDELITVIHDSRDGIPAYRYVRGEDGRPRKEYLSEIVWSNEPVKHRVEVAPNAAE